LPATTLVNRCYRFMFSGCTNLNYIKILVTSIPSTAYYCIDGFASNVAASGTFVKSANAPSTLDSEIPDGWTVEIAS